MSLIDEIGLENLLNVILVKEGIRPAMLIQPANYGETTSNDKITKSITQAIKRNFPYLIQSDKYKIFQGILISKIDYNNRTDISLEKMGEILGYPCYKDFITNSNETDYSVEVYAFVKNHQEISLFANVCKDETNIEQFKIFASKAKEVFDKPEYKNMFVLNGIEIDKVDVEITKNVSTQLIINKLIDNQKLDQDEIDKIQSILFNFGFSAVIQAYFLGSFQYNNPIHKGILLDLLVREQNDTLSPFTPLGDYPEQMKEVDKIIENWEKSLMYILEKTEKTNSTLNQNGNGKTGTRRRKKRSSKNRIKQYK